MPLDAMGYGGATANVQQSPMWSLPQVQVSADVSPAGVNASVQLTGIIVVILVAALVIVSKNWPVG